MERTVTRKQRLRTLASLGCLAMVLTACTTQDAETTGSNGDAPPTDEAQASTPGQPEDVVTDIEVPWDLAFLPDGSALVTQRDTAEVLHVTAEGETDQAGTVDDVSHGGEAGLLGLAVHPDFPDEPYAYAYYTSASDNRIDRITLDPDTYELGESEVILDGVPAANTHNGGRIAFGPDGHLYVGTGDAENPESAQDTESLGGKVLRITDTGEAVDDNPFDNPVHSYGHRNVQGLAWDDEDNFYVTEFGADAVDEVNLVEAGQNYGWPIEEGAGGGDELVDPIVEWEPAEASPSGATVAGDSLYVASLRGARLWQVPLEGGGEVGEPVAHYTDDHGRLRAVEVTPDGDALWLTTSNFDAWGQPGGGDDRIMSVPLD